MDAGRDPATRDFFISYTQADRAWAEWLAWELEAAGYTTLLQAWDMPPGSAFVHTMHQAVQHARHVMPVLSPAYLRSPMAEAEWRPGFVADPGGEARRLMPVQVEACESTGLLADRVWIDLVGLDETAARAELRDRIAVALRGSRRPDAPPPYPRTPARPAIDRPRFPTALPPVWNVPHRRNLTFRGREALLGSIGDHLTGRTMTPGALHGGLGTGKTSVAVEYAYRHRAGFDVVWWVRAEEPATLVGDYAGLAAEVELEQPGQANQQRTAVAVRRWLEDHDRWLLILDNADDP
jgi:TIR domain